MNTAKPRQLQMGVDSPIFSKEERSARIQEIKATVEKYCPDFVKAIWHAKKNKAAAVAMHQEAFAGGYHEDEYILLAMCIKYAGIYNVNVSFFGDG